MKLKDKLLGVYVREGWLVGSIYLFRRIVNRLRSIVFGYALRAPKIFVGPGCIFIGSRFIKLGSRISIFRGMWLEAVTQYQGYIFSPLIIIGNDCGFSDSVHITCIERIEIGNSVLFGSRVFISDHNHGAYTGDFHTPPTEPPAMRRLYSGGAVVIEDNVWIGDNVNIIGPVRIGYGAVIAANSVVRKDVPPRTIVAGAPARVIKIYNESICKWEIKK